ncbi:hypothetical protein SPONN_176 [uncultured Candidatus Thioglobus sp.]|nr:hypothetical protein SPONN_176 [uncultured Candidatus Thioglobus sp.]
MKTKYTYNTLEDFLISHPLTIDEEADDGWGAKFPVKGITIEATILFADISSFTSRTSDLTPEETLFFVNNFFSWITAEAIKHYPCIVDKYIGDEVMLVFSKRFGSEDPFLDAVKCAMDIMNQDVLAFSPHVGIASGKVIAGYVGTPIKYNASLFGNAVNLASRCASIKSDKYKSIIFPTSECENECLKKIPLSVKRGEQEIDAWEIIKPRKEGVKNMGKIKVTELSSSLVHMPMQSATDRAKEALKNYATK